MSLHDRGAAALERMAAGTGVWRVRHADAERAERNGERDVRHEAAVIHLERAAEELWAGLEVEAPEEVVPLKRRRAA